MMRRLHRTEAGKPCADEIIEQMRKLARTGQLMGTQVPTRIHAMPLDDKCLPGEIPVQRKTATVILGVARRSRKKAHDEDEIADPYADE